MIEIRRARLEDAAAIAEVHVRTWQSAYEHGVGDTEHSGARADPERERDHDDTGKHRRLRERTECVREIAYEALDCSAQASLIDHLTLRDWNSTHVELGGSSTCCEAA